MISALRGKPFSPERKWGCAGGISAADAANPVGSAWRLEMARPQFEYRMDNEVCFVGEDESHPNLLRYAPTSIKRCAQAQTERLCLVFIPKEQASRLTGTVSLGCAGFRRIFSVLALLPITVLN